MALRGVASIGISHLALRYKFSACLIETQPSRFVRCIRHTRRCEAELLSALSSPVPIPDAGNTQQRHPGNTRVRG